MSTDRLQSRRLLRHLGVFTPLALATYWAAFMLRFSGDLSGSAGLVFWASAPWVLAVKLAASLYAHAHLDWRRYATFHDVIVLAKTTTLATAGILVLDAMLLPDLNIPRSVALVDWGTTLVLLGALRGLPRALRDGGWRLAAGDSSVRALIVGAGPSGAALLRALRAHTELLYLPVGFIDDRAERRSRRVDGLAVLGGYDDIPAIVKRLAVDEVLIAAGELPGKRVRELLQQAADHNFRVKVLPSYQQLLREHVAIQPRPVAIADLLRRPSVQFDAHQAQQWLRGRTVLVTGSAGSIGSEICRQLLKLAPARIVLVDRSETGQFFLERELRERNAAVDIEVAMADVCDASRLRAIFAAERPAVVFHAAAYKHVPLMESHVGEAVKNIALATRTLADLANEFAVERFVMISTDKAVNPSSVMGACKRLAEQYVQALAAASSCRFVTVRFGNVLDSAGSVVPIFREQIARGGPVTVTHPDMVRYFMLIPEAAQLVIQAGGLGAGGEIFVLDMGEPVRVMDLARDMIRLSGLREGDDIEIRVTGLRPGEKLFEELYADEEHHRRTAHPKIFVSTIAARALLPVRYDMNRLADATDGDSTTLRQLLREAVPEWRAATSITPTSTTKRAA